MVIKMKIEHNEHLFFAFAGLTASGYDGFDRADAEITALCTQITNAGFPRELAQWFARARTGQVEVNPYWPRGSMLAAACFFMDGDLYFDAGCFFNFIQTTGVQDPVGDDDFRRWIAGLPGALRSLRTHPEAGALWSRYCRIADERAPFWREMLQSADIAAARFFGGCAPEMAFAPNLFTPYSADFVRMENRIITIASEPDAETMLHETLHTEIARHRGQITVFAAAHGLAPFADEAKTAKLGYLTGGTAQDIAHVIEECFVRALSVWLSGKSTERLHMHAQSGFTAVPRIAELAERRSITADMLPDFINEIQNEVIQRR